MITQRLGDTGALLLRAQEALEVASERQVSLSCASSGTPALPFFYIFLSEVLIMTKIWSSFQASSPFPVASCARTFSGGGDFVFGDCLNCCSAAMSVAQHLAPAKLSG